MSDTARANVMEELADDMLPRLHWVDNFAKYYASSSMFINKALMKECQWTAHGFKRLPTPCAMEWRRRDDDSIQRCPT